MFRLVGWSLVLVAVYVVGLIVIVALSVWSLFIDLAAREWLAFWLVMPFAWAFGYWPVVGPLVSAYKVWRLMHSFETLDDRVQLDGPEAAEQTKEQLVDTLTDLAAVENGIPHWLARKVVVRMLETAKGKRGAAGASEGQHETEP